MAPNRYLSHDALSAGALYNLPDDSIRRNRSASAMGRWHLHLPPFFIWIELGLRVCRCMIWKSFERAHFKSIKPSSSPAHLHLLDTPTPPSIISNDLPYTNHRSGFASPLSTRSQWIGQLTIMSSREFTNSHAHATFCHPSIATAAFWFSSFPTLIDDHTQNDELELRGSRTWCDNSRLKWNLEVLSIKRCPVAIPNDTPDICGLRWQFHRSKNKLYLCGDFHEFFNNISSINGSGPRSGHLAADVIQRDNLYIDTITDATPPTAQSNENIIVFRQCQACRGDLFLKGKTSCKAVYWK